MRKPNNYINMFVAWIQKKPYFYLYFQIVLEKQGRSSKFTLFVTPVQRIPHALKLKVDPDTKKLVDELIDWVNGLIIEKPNGKPQICLDPGLVK